MILPFSKYHGLGNDFIVLDLREAAFDEPAVFRDLPDFIGDLAVRLCDRHRGIGADGLLLLTGTPTAPAMRVVNADGSVPEMCGNGLRCFVKHVVDRLVPTLDAATLDAATLDAPTLDAATLDAATLDAPTLDAATLDAIIVATDAGPLSCRFSRTEEGAVAEVTVAMGTPSCAPADVPVAADAPIINQALVVDGTTVHITGVGTGNPHLVLFDALDDADRLRLGPLLSAHPLFPAQANVEFCSVLTPENADGASELRCDVFERGCGWTQACGTGATAAATVALRLGRVPAGRPVRVRLPGGWLTIDVTPTGAATMTGPAAHVFDGVVRIS